MRRKNTLRRKIFFRQHPFFGTFQPVGRHKKNSPTGCRGKQNRGQVAQTLWRMKKLLLLHEVELGGNLLLLDGLPQIETLLLRDVTRLLADDLDLHVS